jgi:hypothetical protein
MIDRWDDDKLFKKERRSQEKDVAKGELKYLLSHY